MLRRKLLVLTKAYVILVLLLLHLGISNSSIEINGEAANGNQLIKQAERYTVIALLTVFELY